MPRIARVVASGIPHHIIQRGNRGMPTFFCDADYLAYIDLMAEWCATCMEMLRQSLSTHKKSSPSGKAGVI